MRYPDDGKVEDGCGTARAPALRRRVASREGRMSCMVERRGLRVDGKRRCARWFVFS